MVGLDLPNYAVFGGEHICKARRSNARNPFRGQREVVLAIILGSRGIHTDTHKRINILQKKTIIIIIERK